MQADARQAHTQSGLKGTPTWVRLPREAWPAAWVRKGYRDPVCPRRLPLYGHPDSGGFWEAHCSAHLVEQGFQELTPWRSCFWHPYLLVFLVVYVEDFKMARPTGNLAKAWKLVQDVGLTTPGIELRPGSKSTHQQMSVDISGASIG